MKVSELLNVLTGETFVVMTEAYTEKVFAASNAMSMRNNPIYEEYDVKCILGNKVSDCCFRIVIEKMA